MDNLSLEKEFAHTALCQNIDNCYDLNMLRVTAKELHLVYCQKIEQYSWFQRSHKTQITLILFSTGLLMVASFIAGYLIGGS